MSWMENTHSLIHFRLSVDLPSTSTGIGAKIDAIYAQESKTKNTSVLNTETNFYKLK